MISIPLWPATASHKEVFFSLASYFIYTRDPKDRAYIKPSLIQPKIGHWLFVLNDVNITIFGTPTYEYEPRALYGWNMIGSIFKYDAKPKLIEGPIYWYLHVRDLAKKAYISTTKISPGQGAWLLAFKDPLIKVEKDP